MTFLDIHVLQAMPPAGPRAVTYGGVPRATIRAGHWRRVIREAFLADPGLVDEAGLQTRRLPQLIADRLAARIPALAPDADVIGAAATVAAFGPVRFAMAGRPMTDKPLFLGEGQIERIVLRLAETRMDLLDAAGDDERLEKIVGKLALDDVVRTGHPGAVALFGRLMPGDRARTVTSAVTLTHAVSTHVVTANKVGDCSEEPNDGATLYRFATVNTCDLTGNLGGARDRAVDLAIAFTRAFTTSDSARPDFVLCNVREGSAVNLAGAFEEPVRPVEGGVLYESARRMLIYQRDQDEVYAQQPIRTAGACPAWLADRLCADGDLDVPDLSSLPSTLGGIRAALADRLAQG